MARALEKLRRFFLQRGIDSSTALIAEAISANSIQLAPAGLEQFAVAAAMVKGAAASTSTLTLIKGALKIMAWSKTKTAVVAGVIVLLTAGAGTIAVKHIQMRRHEAQRQHTAIRLTSPIIKISPNGNVQVIPVSALGQLGQPLNSNGSYGHAVAASFSFRTGSSRDAIMRQLDQMHAVILEDSPELIRAQREKTPAMTRNPPEMDFSFTNGKMTRITFVVSKTNAPVSFLGQP